MGLLKDFGDFRKIIAEERKKVNLYNDFKSFTVYSPTFSTYAGGVYEMDLTRAAIHSIANQVSKANPVIVGDKYKSFESVLQSFPNSLMTGQQFLYKWATILLAENTCFLIPIYEDRTAGKIIGIQPVGRKGAEIRRLDGVDYLVYEVEVGGQRRKQSIELDRVGITRNHYYTSDYFGESNSALNATMELLNVQNQGIIEGVKNSNTIRFIMKLANVIADPNAFRKERDRIRDMNLNTENNGGIFMYDAKYSEAKQIDSKPMMVDADQAKLVAQNVFNYFGINEAFVQNRFSETEWDAIYEGRIEPLLIQLSQVVSRMLFTDKDFTDGSKVIYESSRMQYASNETKKGIVVELFDRGFLTHNEGRMIFNLPRIEGGDKYYIRREYIGIDELPKIDVKKEEGKTE